jgi:hypothetical protein
VGALAIAGETGSWWTFQRAQQNAADSAVIAAAIKGATSEGSTVATKYGYTNGSNNVTVTWAGVSSGTCPPNVPKLVSGTSCYQVTINRKIPLYLTQVVGFREGSTVIGTTPAKTISATAIAGTVSSTTAYCLGAQNQIVLNGGGGMGSNAFQGCSAIAGGSLNCSGTNAGGGILYGVAPQNGNNGGQNTCGTPSTNGTYSDPYTAQVTQGLNDLTTCNSTQTGGGTLNTASFVQGGVNCYSGGTFNLGALNVTGANTVIKVSGGGLNLTGALATVGSGTLTIVFTGAQTNGPILTFATGGSLDMASPTSGDWDNIAIAVDPNLAAGDNCVSDAVGNASCDRDITTSGNTPLALAGLIYDPNGTIELNGAITKASSSSNICITFWAKNIVGSGNEYYGVPSPGRDCYNLNHNTPTVSVVALLQ